MRVSITIRHDHYRPGLGWLKINPGKLMVHGWNFNGYFCSKLKIDGQLLEGANIFKINCCARKYFIAPRGAQCCKFRIRVFINFSAFSLFIIFFCFFSFVFGTSPGDLRRFKGLGSLLSHCQQRLASLVSVFSSFDLGVRGYRWPGFHIFCS